MKQIVFRDLAPSIREFHEKQARIKRVPDFSRLLDTEFDVVSIGARPTGKLHIGNIFVLFNAMKYLQANTSAKLMFDIMDLDFDSQRGTVFTPFTSLASTADFLKQVELAVNLICQKLGVDRSRITITPLSGRLDKAVDGLQVSTFRDGLLGMFKDREATKAMKCAIGLPRGSPHVSPLSLICPDCHQSSGEFAVYDREHDRFKAECHNPSCPTETYYDHLSVGKAFNVYYTVDPIRDLLYPGRVLHIFGGDYGLDYGISTIGTVPKYALIAAAMEVARIVWEIGSESPSLFIAPMIVDGDGRKISKSIGNGDGENGSLQTYVEETINKAERILQLVLDRTLEGMHVCVEAVTGAHAS